MLLLFLKVERPPDGLGAQVRLQDRTVRGEGPRAEGRPLAGP